MARVIQRVFSLKDKFSPTMQKIQKGTWQYKKEVQDLKRVGSAAFKSLAVGVAALGAATVGAGAGFTALVNKTAEAGDRIDKMSQRLGLTRQGFQELDYILDQNGVSIDSLGNGMKQFSQQLYGLQTGVKGSSELFKRLGLDSSVAALSQEDAFKKVVAAFQDMEEGAAKADLAQKLFGRSGQEMLPLLNASKGSIEELTEKYNKLGSVMSDEAIDNSVRFKDTLADLRLGIRGMSQSLTTSALPHFTNGIQWLIDKIPTVRKFGVDTFGAINKALEENREKINSVKRVYYDIKNGIADAFGPNGEGGGAVQWMTKTAIPAVIGGIASILETASNTYFFFRNNWSLIGPLIYGIVGALTAYYTITKAITVAKYAWTAAQWALNVAMNANPIGLIVLGIGALIVAGGLLIKNWDDIKLAGKNTWNAIVGFTEWGVNKFIGYVNSMIEGALSGVNFLIRQANKVPGVAIGEISYGIKKADFGKAKFDTEGQEYQWGKRKPGPQDDSHFANVLRDYDQKQEIKINSQQASNRGLINALEHNSEMLERTRGGGNTFNITVNGTDLTAEEIADKLVPRIERKLFA